MSQDKPVETPTTPKEQAAHYIAQGAIQLSRKFRSIGIPPTPPEGKTFLDILRERDPVQWERQETWAREHITRTDQSAHLTLPPEVFNEYLKQTGRSPSIPPAPFTSWADYWAAQRQSSDEPATRVPE